MMESFYFSKFFMESYNDKQIELLPIYGLIPDSSSLETYNEPFLQTYGSPQEVGRDLRGRVRPNTSVSFIWDETPFNTAIIRGEEITLEDVAEQEFNEFLDAYLNRE